MDPENVQAVKDWPIKCFKCNSINVDSTKMTLLRPQFLVNQIFCCLPVCVGEGDNYDHCSFLKYIS